MKTLLVCAALVLGFGGSAFASNAVQAVRSAQTLIGAVDAITDYVAPVYIPGYGLQVSSVYMGSDLVGGDFVEQFRPLVLGLGGTVKGLDKDDWVSLSVGLSYYDGDGYQYLNIVVRVKPNRPKTLEVWSNDLWANDPSLPWNKEADGQPSGGSN